MSGLLFGRPDGRTERGPAGVGDQIGAEGAVEGADGHDAWVGDGVGEGGLLLRRAAHRAALAAGGDERRVEGGAAVDPRGLAAVGMAEEQHPRGVDAAVQGGLVSSRGLVYGAAMAFIAMVVVGFAYDWRKGVFRWR